MWWQYIATQAKEEQEQLALASFYSQDFTTILRTVQSCLEQGDSLMARV
jgi:hypothetical protein